MTEEELLSLLTEIRTPEFLAELSRWRSEGQQAFKDTNWIWSNLIQSAATQGRVPKKYSLLFELKPSWEWSAIAQLTDTELTDRLLSVYNKVGVRFATKKAGWGAENRRKIQAFGGPLAFKEHWASLPLDKALTLLSTFTGVSDKYARNIGMDITDPRFDSSVALDVRLCTVLRHVNPSLPTTGQWYNATEAYCSYLAKKAGITEWELDRTIFSAYGQLKKLCV